MAFILFLIFGDGAQYVFRKLLKPTLALHEETIDLKIDTVKRVSQKKSGDHNSWLAQSSKNNKRVGAQSV